MRASSYVITVALPASNECLLVHGYTGAIDVVPRGVVTALRNGSFDLLLPKDLDALVKRGYITDKTKDEEQVWVVSLARLFHKRASRFHSFMFLVTYDCNFRCTYCCETGISDSGRSWTGEKFSRAATDAAYEVIDNVDTKNPLKGNITLYGGEPLLMKNSTEVHYIVENGLKRGYRFGAITNGYELEFYQDILGTCAINFLQVTIDGEPTVHDRRRRHMSGYGTFNKIFENISLALEAGSRVNVRINVDGRNISQLLGLAEFISAKGFDRKSNFQCYVAALRMHHENFTTGGPLVCGDESCGGVSVLSRRKVAQFLQTFHQEYPEFSFIQGSHFWLKDEIKRVIRTRNAFRFRGWFCGANVGYMIFDPRGDLYTCWDDVGMTSARVGRFIPDLSYDEEMLGKWNERTIVNMKICSMCKYALFCGGGCGAMANLEFGRIDHLHCDEYPKMFKESAVRAYLECCNAGAVA